MIPPARIDPRFNEALIASVWELLARFNFRPSIEPASVSLAVHWLYLTTLAYEGRAEDI